MRLGMRARFGMLALLISLPGASAAGQDALVLDAETIQVDGAVYRLHGIDAPEEGQLCWLTSHLYDCGMVAQTALMDLVIGSKVTCRPLPAAEAAAAEGTARPARCFAAGYDLSEGMTYTGWALADRRTGERYRKHEDGARQAERGLWRGSFVMPWHWRGGARLPQEATGEEAE